MYTYTMEAILFIGIQAVGKSTFYKERFFATHVRIRLDMFKTRQREQLILQACIAAQGRPSWWITPTPSEVIAPAISRPPNRREPTHMNNIFSPA